MESVNDVPHATRRMLRALVIGLLFVGFFSRVVVQSGSESLSVLPPRCRIRTAPGSDGCLYVREERQEYELRYEQARGAVATVMERESAGELLTEVRLNGVATWVRPPGPTPGVHGAGRWSSSRVPHWEDAARRAPPGVACRQCDPSEGSPSGKRRHRG